MLLGQEIVLASPLLGVFLLSSTLRALVASVFLPTLRESRKVRALPVGRLALSVVRVVPLGETVFDIVAGRRGRGEISKPRE
jgi:hypothetical protein